MNDAQNDIQTKLALLRSSYAAQLPEKYAQLAGAWKTLKDEPEAHATLAVMHRMAHSLTGSGATFGFDEISAAARSLERQLKTLLEADSSVVSHACDPIENAMQALQRAVHLATAVVEHGVAPDISCRTQDRSVIESAERVIFIVEDDIHLAEALKLQLGHFGYTPRIFSRIADVEAAHLGAAPAVLIVDLLLPDGNSDEVFAASRIAQNYRVPLIFVSARMDFNSRLQAARAGGVAYFTKPLDIGVLIDRLDILTNLHPAEDYRILVVDDSWPVAKYYANILEQQGMQVEICTDPFRIMQPLAELNPDLVLMDVYMPECSGFEIAAVLRQQEIYLGTPIVFLSTESGIGKQLTGMGLGADDYLTKPIHPGQLVSVVTARVQRARRMRALISHDGLTGLLNHSSIHDALAREMALSDRHKSPLAFVLIDADLFKSINDTHGHQAGDRVLKSLARLLQRQVRKTDHIGRYGGEEFALVLPLTDGATARALVDRLRAVFAELVQHAGDRSFVCTFSAGIASLNRNQSRAQLIEAADLALYQAKEAGRNCVVLAG